MPDLRGLASLTEPDDDVCGVIDLAIMGARGDGKTQFLVHAIRALHARAPVLSGGEQELNRAIMRLVLDPRAPRPDATPPGVVPHFTFRARVETVYDQLGWRGAWRLSSKIARVGKLVVLGYLAVAAGIATAIVMGAAKGVVVSAAGAVLVALASLIARRRLARAGELEIVFWDVAGEQIYSSSAADYHALLGRLVDARRRRAEALGRVYAFAPILICNPLALGGLDEASPYARLRAILPLFAGIDREAASALVAINRWSVVDPICARGARRDELVSVTPRARDESDQAALLVARERVRELCLDAEDGRDGGVDVRYVRYDTALHASVDITDDNAMVYAYDDGPGTFSGDARRRFLDWVVAVPDWSEMGRVVRQAEPEPEPEPEREVHEPKLPPLVAAGGGAPSSSDVWSRPA